MTTTSSRNRADARLALTFQASENGTVMRTTCCEPPFSVMRGYAIPHGGRLAHVLTLGGGLLSGDKLTTAITVEQNAYAQITTVGASRLFRHRVGDSDSSHTTKAVVMEGGLLEYFPEQVIPFRGARHRQRMDVRLAPGAGLLLWDILSPGRIAYGECFDYERLDVRRSIYADNIPIAFERNLIEPAKRSPAAIARLAGYQYTCTFYACRVDDTIDWPALEQLLTAKADSIADDQTLWGASCLAQYGVVVRGLSHRSEPLIQGLTQLWSEARMFLYQQAAVPPRKTY